MPGVIPRDQAATNYDDVLRVRSLRSVQGIYLQPGSVRSRIVRVLLLRWNANVSNNNNSRRKKNRLRCVTHINRYDDDDACPYQFFACRRRASPAYSCYGPMHQTYPDGHVGKYLDRRSSPCTTIYALYYIITSFCVPCFG